VFILLFAHTNSLIAAIILLVLVGMAGGFYVVPLNALLQERGHQTVGAGNAVAVQNFFENCCMLTLIGMYIVMQKTHIPVVNITLIFGGIILFSIGMLSIKRLQQSQRL
jgi:LPLT family lysophospholipid transporter-like MFS transporter